MSTATATMTADSSRDQRRELVDLLERFETTRRDDLAAVCGSVGDATQRLVDQGQVPGYLIVEPQDPAPVVERTLVAVLRRLTIGQR
jgi:hypothetical protein